MILKEALRFRSDSGGYHVRAVVGRDKHLKNPLIFRDSKKPEFEIPQPV